MDSNFNIIQQLLQERADYQARLNLIPYDGSPEIKKNTSGSKVLRKRKFSGDKRFPKGKLLEKV